jgi:hypothetical protein
MNKLSVDERCLKMLKMNCMELLKMVAQSQLDGEMEGEVWSYIGHKLLGYTKTMKSGEIKVKHEQQAQKLFGK